VLITLKVKLNPTREIAEKLRDTMRRFNLACDYISEVAFTANKFGQVEMHKLTYHQVRQQFKLPAQLAVRAIGKVVEAYKVDKKTQRSFKPLGAIAYDQRILTWKGVAQISLTTLEGRELIPVIFGGYQEARFNRVRGQADLLYQFGKFYLCVVVEVDEEAEFEPVGYLGVDLGIVQIASDSDGNSYSGKQVNGLRKRHAELRSKLQAKGTKSAKRLLKKRGLKEQRFAKQENHRIAKELVTRAKDTTRGIALEDLTGIRERVTVRKAQRRVHHSWAFHQLKNFVLYKAKIAGVPVKLVDPRNTSRTCSRCGHCEKANRKSQSEFKCLACGFVVNADLNAAKNIGRAAVNQPNVSFVGVEHGSTSSFQGQSLRL
jgi:putative transposase